MSRRRASRGRDVHGILLLDKPDGITSNEALQYVKRLYGARKAGHTGSLDKTATGLLPLCFGDATKFSSHILESDKRYLASCQLGVETTTGDAAGEIISQQAVPELGDGDIEKVLAEFRGEIEQVPPMYSALKHKGQRLYKLAYAGKVVERAPRRVNIRQLQLLRFEHDSFDIDVVCSKGTYIRSLAEDIGRGLGCGAHVASLRRVAAGPFTSAQMVTMNELETLAAGGEDALDGELLGIDTALSALPEVRLVENVAYYLCLGQAVTVPNAPTQGFLRLYARDQRFLGMGEVLDDGRIAPRRLVNLN